MLLLMAGAIVAGAFYVLYQNNRRKALAAASWPSVEGRITTSAVYTRRDRDDGKLEYHSNIAFVYSVNGVNLAGNTVRFGFENFGKAAAEHVCARYPAGASVPVYYDPANPSRSVLEPGRRAG